MKKELGKWLLDIAKYILTAGIIAPWIGDSAEWVTLSTLVVFCAAAISLSIGLLLIHAADKEEKKKQNKKGR